MATLHSSVVPGYSWNGLSGGSCYQGGGGGRSRPGGAANLHRQPGTSARWCAAWPAVKLQWVSLSAWGTVGLSGLNGTTSPKSVHAAGMKEIFPLVF